MDSLKKNFPIVISAAAYFFIRMLEEGSSPTPFRLAIKGGVCAVLLCVCAVLSRKAGRRDGKR